MRPLCIHCQHYRPAYIGMWPLRKHTPEYGKCARVDVSPVDGRATSYCDSARRSYGDCGPDGKLFEARAQEAA